MGVRSNSTVTKEFRIQVDGSVVASNLTGADLSYTPLVGEIGDSITFEGRVKETANAVDYYSNWQTFASGIIAASGAGGGVDFTREFSRQAGTVTIDLSVLGPAEDGAASYALVGTPAGYGTSGSDATVNTALADAGVVVWQRTDNAGVTDLSFTFTFVQAKVIRSGDDVEIEVGNDDPDTLVFDITSITGGDFDGENPDTVTWGDIDGQPFSTLTPVYSLTTDTGTAGEWDAGDQGTKDHGALWAYEKDAGVPTFAQGWYDQTGSLAVSADVYTAGGSEDTSIYLRNSADSVDSDSTTKPVAGGAPAFHPTDLFGAGDDGYYWDANESTLWTGSVGGTEVTADDATFDFIEDLSGNGNTLSTTGGAISGRKDDGSGNKYFHLDSDFRSIERNGAMAGTDFATATHPRSFVVMVKGIQSGGNERFVFGENANNTVDGASTNVAVDRDGSVEFRNDATSGLQAINQATTGLPTDGSKFVVGYRSGDGVTSITDTDDIDMYFNGTDYTLASDVAGLTIGDDDYRVGRYRSTDSGAHVVAAMQISRRLSDAEMASLRTYMLALAA